jgi:hypothetical protein
MHTAMHTVIEQLADLVIYHALITRTCTWSGVYTFCVFFSITNLLPNLREASVNGEDPTLQVRAFSGAA